MATRTRALTVARPQVINVSAPRRALVGRRSRRKAKFTVPMAIVLGIMPAIIDVKDVANVQQVPLLESIAHTGAGLLGYDTFGKRYVGWRQAKAAGAVPLLLGFGAHWAAGKLGVNRAIARTGLPLLRI